MKAADTTSDKPVMRLALGSYQTTVRFLNSGSLSSLVSGEKTLFVCDEHTKHYLPEVAIAPVVLSAGETYKSWDSVNMILHAARARDMARDDAIVAVGGGVICDTAAFAASIYMRGCRLFLVPTTLLSMIDASVGGKTGVDFDGAKNLIGTFYPANEVLIMLDALDTLPEREYRSGLAEGIKHALLGDHALFTLFAEKKTAVMARERSCVEKIVSASLAIKGEVVEADLRERGVRAHLNLGHTFGHALESVTGFTLLTHGEAVAWGIGKALKLGLVLGVTDHNYAARAWALLSLYGFPMTGIEFSPDELVATMKADKKRQGGAVRFIVQESLGVTRIVTAGKELYSALLDDLPIE